MLIYNESLSDVIFATQTEEQKSKGTNAITILNTSRVTISGRRGKYKARTFYSTKPVEINNFTTPEPIILFPCGTDEDDIFLLDSSLGDVNIEVSGKYIDEAQSKFRCSCIIYNNTASSVNIESVKFSDSHPLPFEANGNTGTIEPFGEFNSTGEISFPTFPINVTAVVGGKTYTGIIN